MTDKSLPEFYMMTGRISDFKNLREKLTQTLSNGNYVKCPVYTLGGVKISDFV